MERRYSSSSSSIATETTAKRSSAINSSIRLRNGLSTERDSPSTTVSLAATNHRKSFPSTSDVGSSFQVRNKQKNAFIISNKNSIWESEWEFLDLIHLRTKIRNRKFFTNNKKKSTPACLSSLFSFFCERFGIKWQSARERETKSIQVLNEMEVKRKEFVSC